MDAFKKEGSGYLAIQNSRPQTIGYGLADSPLLQLAWIAGKKVQEWTDLPVDRDQVLTTVSLYWFYPAPVPRAAHSLYEQAHSSDWGAPPAVPQGLRGLLARDETVRKLVPAPADAHWTEFERGQHFPAMEAPAQLAADLQAFFRAAAVTDVLSQRAPQTGPRWPRQFLLETRRRPGPSTRSSTWGGIQSRAPLAPYVGLWTPPPEFRAARVVDADRGNVM